MNEDISINRLIFLISIIFCLTLILKPLINFIQNILNKIFKSKTESSKDNKEELPKATDDSTAFFSYRMSSAFPGTRGITWFNNPKTARQRLEILLKKPICFDSESSNFESDPIWWFRGFSAMYIRKFNKLGNSKVLMNMDQLKIKRIAVLHQKASYYRDFVYVEVEKEKEIGIYKYDKGYIENTIERNGYYKEEYGLIKKRFGRKAPITISDYDDGATIIRGKVQNDLDTELRIRYLSNYNFIIAAKGSPYNSKKFNLNSKKYLDGILKNKVQPEQFFNYLASFNKNENY